MINILVMTRHVSKLLAAAFLAAAMALTFALMPVFGQTLAETEAEPAPPVMQTVERVPGSPSEITLTFAPLVRDASPAVVNVYTERTVATRATPLEQMLYGVPPQGRQVQNSLGSGVIVGADGVIVTNNHVIQGADAFRVVLSDRREYPAELLLADARTD
ncbi:MAG: trypsin-like peptidase domain-containing protein, partial [Pararhodobacter sp.]